LVHLLRLGNFDQVVAAAVAAEVADMAAAVAYHHQDLDPEYPRLLLLFNHDKGSLLWGLF
jgi:hypothetical protein